MTRIKIQNNFEIDDQKPRPDFDQPPALAYEVYRPGETQAMGYALVCDPKAPPRLHHQTAINQLETRPTLLIYGQGVVDWPLENRKCPVLIMDFPSGPKVFPQTTSVLQPLDEDLIINQFMLPMIKMLMEMHDKNILHRMMRADNLYFTDHQRNGFLVGECLSSPLGLAQPMLYETLENCKAQAAGRRNHIDCDIYMLGVCVMALLTGHIPMAGLEDKDVFKKKLALGSYNALAQGLRVSNRFVEILKGMLSDNPEARWNAQMVVNWCEGQRQTPPHALPPPKANRSINFAGQDYYTAGELAHALFKYWDQGVSLSRTNAISTWIRYNLDDSSLLRRFQTAAGGAYVPEGVDYNWALARIIIALDPYGPIRYREISTHISAIPSYLSYYINDATICEQMRDMMNQKIPDFQFTVIGFESYLDKQEELLNNYRKMMNKTYMGQGMERVVYENLNGVSCQSLIFEREFVTSAHEIIPILEELCADGRGREHIIDRHFAAFLQARASDDLIDREISRLDKGFDTIEGRIAQIKILGHLQKKFKYTQIFPNLAKLAVEILTPATERFYSRSSRETVIERMKKSARKGKLNDLLNVVDSPTQIKSDRRDFREAGLIYGEIIYNLVTTLYDLTNKTTIARRMGMQISSVIASILSLVIIVIGAIFYLTTR